MRVVIISDRLRTTSQLRFALSAVKHPCTVTDHSTVATLEQDLRRGAEDAGIIFVAMPFDANLGAQILRQLRPLSAARIVAVGLAESPQQILQLLHAGADDFLDEGGDIHEQVKTELDRVSLAMREPAAAPAGCLIAVTGAVGGAGATLTAANLAVLLARDDRPCGLIDLSGGFGDLATLFGLQPRYTLRELCSNSESLDLEMLKKSITEHSSGVRIIASAAVTSEWEFDSTQATRRVVETSCRLLPSVVLDLDRRTPYSRALLAKSDLIVLMTNLDFRAACSTQRLLESWTEGGIASERIVLVANRCRRKGELAPSMVESLLGRPIDCQFSDDPQSANLSVNCGNPTVLECPQSTLSKELRQFERIVFERIHGAESTTEPSRSHPHWNHRSLAGLLKRVAGAMF